MQRRFSTWLPHAIGLLPIVLFTAILCVWSRPKVVSPKSPTVVVQNIADSAEAVPLGTVRGRIVLVGANSKPKVLVQQNKAIADPHYCATDGPILDESLIVGPNGGVANVFVYFRDRPKRAPDSMAQPMVIDLQMERCRFQPRALICRTRDTLRVSQLDDIAHNPKFDLAGIIGVSELLKGRVCDLRFPVAQPRSVEFVCATHSWMSGHILVVDHDYAVLTTDSGEFELTDVPAGKQILNFCHERTHLETRTVFVSPDQVTDLGDIELDNRFLDRP